MRRLAKCHPLETSLPETFRVAYPDSTEAAAAALRQGDRRWPGAAILWVSVDGAATRLLDTTPHAALAGRC